MHGARLRVEYAEVSLLGARESNQDRVGAAVAEHAALLVACRRHGRSRRGRARGGGRPAGASIERFWHTPQPLFDPLGFLHLALGRAHEEVVKLGTQLPLEQRPRATCACAWCSSGRPSGRTSATAASTICAAARCVARTRDHSHVELLLREGLISAEQAHNHPMRNFVECCLGGDPMLPEMTISRRRPLERGDVLLVCTDGLWGCAQTTRSRRARARPGALRDEARRRSARRRCKRAGAGSDNTSAAALRWLGD